MGFFKDGNPQMITAHISDEELERSLKNWRPVFRVATPNNPSCDDDEEETLP